MGKISNDSTAPDRSPLLPDRTGQGDLFVCDIFDAAPKGDMASMEHPIFSLSTKPDHRRRRYEHGRNFVEIKPSADGLATVHDRDILIYCISQLIAALNEGRPVTRKLSLHAHDLLQSTNRMTNGQAYEALKASLRRLQGTQIETNLVTGGTEQFDVFGLIDRARIVRETREGRMQEIEITLSDWVFNAIEANEVLTLHRDYFRLRKPLERRIYELARKHCGAQPRWRISLDLLQKKSGSNSTPKEFRRLITTIVRHDEVFDHMPDYSVRLDGDKVLFERRASMKCLRPAKTAAGSHDRSQGGRRQIGKARPLDSPSVAPETFDKARDVAPGYDVHFLHREWLTFTAAKGEAVHDPDKAFVGFCRKRAERTPLV